MSNYGEFDDEWIWVDVGAGKQQLVKRSTIEAPVDHPMKSEVYGDVQINMGTSRENRKYHLNKPYVSRGVPLHHPDAPHHDEMGRAVFTSAQEEREFMAKTGASNDGAHLEENEYTAQKDLEAIERKKLPHEDDWQRAKRVAVERGLLPRKGEPRSEQERRKNDYLRKQDKAMEKASSAPKKKAPKKDAK